MLLNSEQDVQAFDGAVSTTGCNGRLQQHRPLTHKKDYTKTTNELSKAFTN